MITIDVRKRSFDVHAQVKGDPRYWGCGKTADEAVGSVIRSHPLMFGLTIDYPDVKTEGEARP